MKTAIAIKIQTESFQKKHFAEPEQRSKYKQHPFKTFHETTTTIKLQTEQQVSGEGGSKVRQVEEDFTLFCFVDLFYNVELYWPIAQCSHEHTSYD